VPEATNAPVTAPTTGPTDSAQDAEVTVLPNTGAPGQQANVGSSKETMIIGGLAGLAAALGLRLRRREQ
jgi:MYXO-CTERM domain-containing protein